MMRDLSPSDRNRTTNSPQERPLAIRRPGRVCHPAGLLTGCLLTGIICGLLLMCGPVAADIRTGKPKEDADSKTLRVQPAARFEGFPESVTCVAFSPDGRILAAGSYGLVRLFDTESKSELGRLEDMAGFVKSLAFTPDGRLLVGGGYQKGTVWDVATRERVRELKGHRGYITSIAFAAAGDVFATASDDETVRLWGTAGGGTAGGESQRTVKGFRFPVNSVAIGRNGTLLAAATGDVNRPAKKGEVLLLTMDGEVLQRLEGHERSVQAVAISPDGSLLASAGIDETIRLWNTTDGSFVRTLEGHSRPVNAVVFHPNGRYLFSCSGGRAKGGNEVRLWRVDDGRGLGLLAAHSGPIPHLALSSDAHWLATASLDKSVKLWDVGEIVRSSGDSSSIVASDVFGLAESLLNPKKKNPQAPGAKPVVDPAQPAANPVPSLPEAETPPAADRPSEPELPGEMTWARGVTGVTAGLAAASLLQAAQEPKAIRVGIIGLDTSHATAFTQMLNAADAKDDIARCRVVAAYPKGSPDIVSSTSRVPGYIEEVKKHGVEIVESIDDLLTRVDAVLLESNDGRPHLEQILPCLKAGKPVFIDKPIAGSLTDAVAIFEAARHYKVPVFSASSLRFSAGAQAIRRGETVGEVKGCDAYSPCYLEATHPDLFWYGIHGVETLFTVMGTGCESVSRVNTPGIDLVAGTWKGGRVGTFRGIRTEAGGGVAAYGGQAFGTKGIAPVGGYDGYRPLLVAIVQFFRDGKAPIAEEETLEIYAFMEAADESKRLDGGAMKLAAVLEKARTAAEEKLKPLLK